MLTYLRLTCQVLIFLHFRYSKCMAYYIASKDEEKEILKKLEMRQNAETARIKRYLAMPDLSRTPGNPLRDIVEKAKSTPSLKDFDDIDIPEIIDTRILFDLFDFPADHPARSKSDTYYADDTHVLRTHDTVMWYYYLNLPEVKEKIGQGEAVGVVCYGKVFRKDEIDRKHMNIFHQFGGLYLQPDSMGIVPIEELRKVLSQIVKSLFGENVKYRFLDDTFPYTDPSLQVEVEVNGEWIEILGGGMPKKSSLSKMGIEGYNGWAFGFGLERLAIISMELPDIRLLWSSDERVTKQLKLGTKFVEVSKYPPIVRDISFVVKNSFVPNDYFDIVRETAPEIVEQVELLDKYENVEKFGSGMISYAFRITYRSLDRTLTSNEIDNIHKKLEEATKKNYEATVR
ncbi:MAG: Phenylalanine-trna synthetase-like protein [Parcubacteria group bacterium GW2011_GWA2_40_14]|nr:MAG: Phenylalanine-trna synthetase-like protein [Parcubacteria group bacterium GW2011_GWA2_40_14]